MAIFQGKYFRVHGGAKFISIQRSYLPKEVTEIGFKFVGTCISITFSEIEEVIELLTSLKPKKEVPTIPTPILKKETLAL